MVIKLHCRLGRCFETLLFSNENMMQIMREKQLVQEERAHLINIKQWLYVALTYTLRQTIARVSYVFLTYIAHW